MDGYLEGLAPEPQERWAALGDGYHIEVRLIRWAGEAVTQVPLGAVFRQGSGWACYVIDVGRAQLRRIEGGHRGETGVEIVVGVKPGQGPEGRPQLQL